MFDFKATDLQDRMSAPDMHQVSVPAYLKGGTRRIASASFAKIVLDKIIAGFALIVLFPVMLAVGVAIHVTAGGPVVFRHMRVGLNGRVFGCLKFRTMVPEAEGLLQDILETDPVARAEWQARYKFEHDCRVTRLGRFLRKTSLDELPQLFNVLRGDMSLVGPRPITEAELDVVYGPHAAIYKSVRPGVTGLWQVCGRSDTNYDERISLDLRYIRSASLIWDIRIIFQTIGIVLAGRGAV